MSNRAFRFGVVAAAARSGQEWRETAHKAEELGFDTLIIPDNVQHTLAPFAALATAAAVTSRLRVGTYVLANDYRHPVMVAKEAASLDFLSDGRFELGIGAGRPTAEGDYAMLGLQFGTGGQRLSRLAEALPLIKRLLAGEQVTLEGAHYTVVGAAVSPGPVQRAVPIMVAASQPRLLALAGREADIVALGLGPQAIVSDVGRLVEIVREAAGARFDGIELNTSLMAVGGQVPRYWQSTLGDRAAEMAAGDGVPILKGSVAQMADRLRELRERLGITYFVAADELMEAMAPVVKELGGK